ncbi:MAG: hypothetical protein OES13_00300 [Acidimicrobiia bacterium]|nr:hypothetical protein [Acidimicrobiia bacterium]
MPNDENSSIALWSQTLILACMEALTTANEVFEKAGSGERAGCIVVPYIVSPDDTVTSGIAVDHDLGAAMRREPAIAKAAIIDLLDGARKMIEDPSGATEMEIVVNREPDSE